MLDTYAGASGAWSLRELSTAWAGLDVVRIVRSGGTEQDFTASEITDGTLKTFCDAGVAPFTGKIVTWYDQSGNTNDLSFVTSPTLYNGTSVVTENGEPAIDFVGATDEYGNVSSSNILTGADFSVFAVAQCDTNAVAYLVATEGGGATGARRSFYSHSLQLGSAFKGSNTGTSLSTWDRTQSTISMIATDMQTSGSHTIDTWVDGGSNSQWTGTGLITPATDNFRVGGETIWNGRIQEVVVYDSDETSNHAGIESNINTHYSIY